MYAHIPISWPLWEQCMAYGLIYLIISFVSLRLLFLTTCYALVNWVGIDSGYPLLRLVITAIIGTDTNSLPIRTLGVS